MTTTKQDREKEIKDLLASRGSNLPRAQRALAVRTSSAARPHRGAQDGPRRFRGRAAHRAAIREQVA